MPSVRATRGRRRKMLGAAAALALVALLVPSCGGNSNAGLSQDRASSLRSSLDRVESRVHGGDCTAATQQAADFRRQVDSLPAGVDRDLRDALQRSATRLESLVSEQCKPVQQPPAQGTTSPDQNPADQQGNGKKDKKPKKPKKDQGGQQPPDTGGTTGVTGSTGTTGSTGATGLDGGTAPPGGG